MIDHRRALELAAASIDFGLSSTDEMALTQHLAGCQACRETVAGLHADAAALRAFDPIDAPSELRDRIVAAAPPPTPPIETSPAPTESRVLPFPRRIPRPAALAAAAAVLVAVIGGTLWWQGGSAPDGVAVVDASGHPVPSASGSAPGVSPGASENPPDDVITPAPQLADLTADGEAGGIVDPDTSFRLAALGGRSAVELAQHLTVQPHIELRSTVEADGRVRLTPTEPLTPGTVYRFSIDAADGATDSWAFQAAGPLHVVSTLPADSETDVPLTTGIEVTFDQDGVAGASDHFSIEPKVDGRFEQHGRVLAFVPSRLLPKTLYTVTITRGVGVEGTDATLEKDVRFRFETTGSGNGRTSKFLRFSNDLFESATSERPIVGLWWFDDSDENSAPPRSTRLDVFRFTDQASAISAFQTLRNIPRWSQWNAIENVPTAGLTRVAHVNAALRNTNGTLWTALPERLRAGWYLIEHPDGRATTQAIIQVTDLAAYLAVSERKSLVWANDLATGHALGGATVRSDGTTLGRTGGDGLLVMDTPRAWRPGDEDSCITGCPPVVVVTAGTKSAFIPASGAASPDGKDTSLDWWGGVADPTYWTLFETDRSRYRPNDTINAWGMVRDRDTGKVPSTVEVRLVLEGDDAGVPIAVVTAAPRPTGTFTAPLLLRDVPMGSYRLELRADGVVVTSRYIPVERIIKPAYQVAVTTGRRVYVTGDRIRVTATARFFEGTPVPGVPLRLDGDVSGSMTTDVAGVATLRGTARWGSADEPRDGLHTGSVGAWPARAEEGDSELGYREFYIFPSHWVLDSDATISGRRLRISGTANELDRDRVEREVANGTPMWDIDTRGKGLAGRTVRARIVEYIPIRRQIATSYDFVEKRTVPIYDYDQRSRLVTTLRLRTGVDGRFHASVAIPDARHHYEVELTISDPEGLRVTSTTDVYPTDDPYQQETAPELRSNSQAIADQGEELYGVGDRVDLTMEEPGAPGSVRDDPHLFLASQGGIRTALVHDTDRLLTRFPDWGAPDVVYRGVRFTGRSYLTTGPYVATFRIADRAITVKVTADRDRYEPGDTARLSVTTLGPGGRPMPSSVVIRAVDEKLYSIGDAAEVDPLARLYEQVPEGLVATYATHRGPSSMGQGADTGGGGDGDAPHDAILFRAVDTDASGHASVEMALPADLTSWHVAVSAIGAGLEAGGASLLVPVSLPLFVDTSIAPEYLVADRPVLQLRAFGAGLTADSTVTFSVDAPSLGLHQRGLSAPAFRAVKVTLPKLAEGHHQITITAQTGHGVTLLRHVLTRSFDVVASRLTHTRVAYSEPTAAASLRGAGGGLSEVVVADAGLGRLLPVLYELADANTARIEGALAKDVAAELLAGLFGENVTGPAPSDFSGASYQRDDGGISLVPYGSSDLDVSSLVALTAPERFDGGALRGYLRTVIAKSGETRERYHFALAGLGGLREPVLPQIRRALEDPELTIRERLVLGIAAGRLGDTATARRVATDLARAYGERLGSQARLRVGADNLDATNASALMAMLLASFGDPVAASYHEYVAANATDQATFALHDLAYARWMATRLSTKHARFAYVVGGTRHEVDLEPGTTFRIVVPRADRSGFSIEPLEGRVGVTETWREPVDPGGILQDDSVRISRTVKPSGSISQSSLVVVDLHVSFGASAPEGCHRVVDLVPSGLVPITGVLRGAVDPETGEPLQTSVTYPDAQVGQQVLFCAEPTRRQRDVVLRYVARVISTGTYRWEPAMLESRTVPDAAATTPAARVTIK